jgi:hypothetical protein
MKALFSIILITLSLSVSAQSTFPWENPLVIARSTDGINFSNRTIFQDSSGVPSAIKWKGDTLICAFQWFRQPNPSPSWDRVAVKYSYDNGLTWTEPTPIVITGIPAQYQRAFDPTLVKLRNSDSIRVYFSSSATPPTAGLDSTVNTYSAVSADGINYTFENSPRVDVLNNRAIDPAVIYFNNSWHYHSPIGAPQDGAYHYLSNNGLNFSAVSNVPSDAQHNWTGNFVVEDSSELRFYGSGAMIWYNSSPNGGVWNGYVNTNVQGGDPTVVKLADNNYLMIYVGPSNFTAIHNQNNPKTSIYPNPTTGFLFVENVDNDEKFEIYNSTGQLLITDIFKDSFIKLDNFPKGLYFIKIRNEIHKIIKH